MDHILGADRNQLQFLSLEQLVAEDSWARVIDLFVDVLPLKELGFKHAELKKEGRPPYDPSTLLKLYLYGYKHSIRSSRKLEQSCRVNVELWWLLKGLTPSFRSIAYFRKENAEAFKSVFRQFVLMLKKLDLIDGETVAIDSFKIFAQNSLKKNFTHKKIDRHLHYIDQKVEEYEKQLDEADAAEKQVLKAKIECRQVRRKKYSDLKTQLTESGETQISLTDKDARALMLTNNVSGIGYSIQAATDKKNKLFLHAHIGATNDKRELATAALEVKSLLNLKSFKTLSDAGYTTGDQLSICKQEGITTFSSPMPSTSPSSNCFPLSMFIYDKKQNFYTCPSGERMTTHAGWTHRANYRSRVYKTKACTNCSLREKCTQNKIGRVIERSEYQDVIDENNNRVLANPDYYRLRQQIIEHQFGVLKRQWGFTFTLMRGKENVLSEVNLLMIIYNLKRSISIIGKDELRKRLRELFPALNSSLYLFFGQYTVDFFDKHIPRILNHVLWQTRVFNLKP